MQTCPHCGLEHLTQEELDSGTAQNIDAEDKPEIRIVAIKKSAIDCKPQPYRDSE
jgi:hypothetical protein